MPLLLSLMIQPLSTSGNQWAHFGFDLFHHSYSSEVKKELEETAVVFSPETNALIKGLSDSPESLQLKAEILRAANELKRGPLSSITMVA